MLGFEEVEGSRMVRTEPYHLRVIELTVASY